MGEAVAAQWPIFFIDPFPAIINLAKDTFVSSAVYGLIGGIVFGIGFAAWDLIRNHYNQSASGRLFGNLLYFLFYASCIIAVNCILCALILLLNFGAPGVTAGRSTPVIVLTVIVSFGCLMFNFTAILWAAIRSITTDDILTPRVLREKLRRSSRLS